MRGNLWPEILTPNALNKYCFLRRIKHGCKRGYKGRKRGKKLGLKLKTVKKKNRAKEITSCEKEFDIKKQQN